MKYNPDEIYIGGSLIYRRLNDNLSFRIGDTPADVVIRINRGERRINAHLDSNEVYSEEVEERITDVHMMFLNQTAIEEIISLPDFSLIEDMSCMFEGCGIKEIDFEKLNLNTKEITSVSGMFWNTKNLKEVDLTPINFSKSKTVYLGQLCEGSGIETINLSSLYSAAGSNIFYNSRIKNVIFPKDHKLILRGDLSHMFDNCKSLEYIDFSDVSIEHISSISHMFYFCSNLKEIKFGKIDFKYEISQAVFVFNYMFSGCGKLTKISGEFINLVGLSIPAPIDRESALNFIEAMSEENPDTIYFSETTYSYLQPEDIALATSKGWSIAITITN